MITKHAKHGIAAVLTCLILIGGCSTNQYAITEPVTAPKTVRLHVENHRNAKSYSRDFVAVLESAGFVVASTDNPDALELTVGFNPNIFATGFEVQLTQRGIVLIKVDSTNYGWGTGVGRGAAIDNLASNTWRAFADQLDELKPRLTIVSD